MSKGLQHPELLSFQQRKQNRGPFGHPNDPRRMRSLFGREHLTGTSGPTGMASPMQRGIFFRE